MGLGAADEAVGSLAAVLRLTPLNLRIIRSSAGGDGMREMRAVLTIVALGIGAAGVNGATIQSPPAVGVLETADPGQNGDNGGAVTPPPPSSVTLPTTPSPGAAQSGSDPFDWPQTAPIAVSKGGSAKGYGARGGGRRYGASGAGHGKSGGRSRGSGHAGRHSSSGHSGARHSGGKGKGG